MREGCRRVSELSAGERGEESEGLELVGRLGARHVGVQVPDRVCVVETAGQPTAVCQAELENKQKSILIL